MQVETKYNIDDIIKFNRVITYSGGTKKSENEIHVGIIEKILISKAGISYLMQSSYQGWVDEGNIICTLLEEVYGN